MCKHPYCQNISTRQYSSTSNQDNKLRENECDEIYLKSQANLLKLDREITTQQIFNKTKRTKCVLEIISIEE